MTHQTEIPDPAITVITFRCDHCPNHPCTQTRRYDTAWYQARELNREIAHRPRQVCNAYPNMDGHTDFKRVV